MELVRRRAGWVLTVGLLTMLGWSLAVSASMPSWYDPDRDCLEAFPLVDADLARVAEHWLPPRAACVYRTGETHQFISTTRSIVLTIICALTVALTLIGLYYVVRRLTGPPGLLRSAEAVDLRSRQLRHLGIGGGLTLLILAVYSGANVLAAVLAGPPGALVMAVTTAIALSAVAAAIDREQGPLPSTVRDSRRRGTVIGLGTFTVIFVLTVAAGQFPFYQLWIAPVGAVAYLVLAGLQWSRRTRSAQLIS
ncbi:hypothetical protein AB0P21_21585 [Kribbella sp. NPDC056861]|uniref:hypothetical protein n=1 Tax=Kribbella sp. NPDC056861 TaxID=3154857 RepID=UPI003447C994